MTRLLNLLGAATILLNLKPSPFVWILNLKGHPNCVSGLKVTRHFAEFDLMVGLMSNIEMLTKIISVPSIC